MKDISTMVLEEGLDVLFREMGIVKTIKFIQLISLGKGDAVQEIETETEKMSKEEALAFINKIRQKNIKIWKEFGLL